MTDRRLDQESIPGRDWLQELHNRSWEMELLIVGFALLVLLRVPELTIHKIQQWEAEINSPLLETLFPLLYMLLIGARIMIFNLVLHLLLRGYWIGVIGLNSAYRDGIDFERLGYAPAIKQLLVRKVIDLKSVALKVDKICSVIFAFTFLLIFLFISMGLFFVGLFLIGVLAAALPAPAETAVGLGLLIPYLLTGMLYALDFLTLGRLKKINAQWFALPFFYIARFYRLFTLSFIYESIYYTLIGNISRWLIGVILLGYIVAINFFLITRFNSDIFYPRSRPKSPHHMSRNYYEDMLPELTVITTPIIQSRTIQRPYLELFIPYNVADNDSLAARCPELRPFRKPGLTTRFTVTYDTTEVWTNLSESSEANIINALDCFRDLYTISMNDSLHQQLQFVFYRHPNQNEPGILTHIGTTALKPGLNILKIQKNLTYDRRRERERNLHFIPFWLE